MNTGTKVKLRYLFSPEIGNADFSCLLDLLSEKQYEEIQIKHPFLIHQELRPKGTYDTRCDVSIVSIPDSTSARILIPTKFLCPIDGIEESEDPKEHHKKWFRLYKPLDVKRPINKIFAKDVVKPEVKKERCKSLDFYNYFIEKVSPPSGDYF